MDLATSGVAVAVAVGALACGLAGWGVPALIARVPEPDAQPDGQPDGQPEDPVEEIASAVVEGSDEPAPHGVPTSPDAVSGEAEDPEEPKELYADIAARPGLAWRAALVSAVVGGLLGWSLGWHWPLLVWLPLVPLAVALGYIDWRTQLLPTKLIWPAYAVTVAALAVCWVATRDTSSLVRSFWGWLIAGGVFFLLWVVYPRGLGYGDVRLSGVLGLGLGYLGWGPLLVGVYAAFLLGGVGGGLLSLLKIVRRTSFPFGPFMLVGALVGVLVGERLLSGLAGA